MRRSGADSLLKPDIADAAVIGFKSVKGMELIAFYIPRNNASASRKDSENFKKQASIIHDTLVFIEQKRFPF